MRYESDNFWAEAKPVWTFGDQMAVRAAATRGDGSFDEEVATVSVVLTATESWSAGEVSEAVLLALPASVVNRYYQELLAHIAGGPDPKASSRNSSPRRTRAA